MARIKHFYVHTLASGKPAHGEAEVTWNPSTGSYDVVARTARCVTKGSVYFNEAGFRGRQWECNALSDNQFETLREAVQALLAESASYTRSREDAIRLGVRPPESPINPEFAS
jgi:hypothetical protein